MKKIVLYSLAGIIALAFILWIGSSCYVVYTLSKNEKRFSVTYKIERIDKLSKFKVLEKSNLKYPVCPSFTAIKLRSEKTHIPLGNATTCVLSFKGQRMMISDDNFTLKMTPGILTNSSLKENYIGKTKIDLIEIYREFPRPDRYFYFKQKHYDQAFIYVNSLSWGNSPKARVIKKYKTEKYLVYIWEGIEPPEEGRVDYISNDLMLSCRGFDCLDYFHILGLI